jgi:predicted RNA-binding protein YlqC (UPF0109 family)
VKDLIKQIVQALVDEPEQVEISEAKGENVLVLEHLYSSNYRSFFQYPFSFATNF